MAIFKDVHKAIIERDKWGKVQEKKTRKRKANDGEKNMFSGLLVCADCGRILGYHFNQANHSIKYYNCQNNNRTRKTCATTHYIRVDFLEQIIISEIRRLMNFAEKYEDDFLKLIIGNGKKTNEAQLNLLQKELSKLIARNKDLDKLFEKLYEDNVTEKISDDRFAKMSANFEIEQGENLKRIKNLKTEIEVRTDKTMSVNDFISTVRKYTRVKKLSERMLNELIEKIEVFQSEKVDSVNVQRLRIFYNCVGEIEILETEEFSEIPNIDISMNTRKGVKVNYSALG